MNKEIIIVAIDGPAGAGKSSVTKELASLLGFAYLDTGAMYRSLTLKALRQGINLEDEEGLVMLAGNTKISLKSVEGQERILLDGEDVSEEIRSRDVTNNAFYIARAPKVREIMVGWQREVAKEQSIVAEGRDIGTVVFPQATYKFYLDAKEDERARRRIEELRLKGLDVDTEKIKQDIAERDHRDKTRSVGALKQAEDAVYIDSTDMSVEETVNKMFSIIRVNEKTIH